jgi:hypothetical protein
MNAKVRRRLEMAGRALQFSRAYPNESPGYRRLVTRLEELVQQADELAVRQRDGSLQVHAAALRKQELRRTMKLAHLEYLARVGEAAAEEEPELGDRLKLLHASRAYLNFRNAVLSIITEAENRRDLLARHGLAETVLGELAHLLEQFDRATDDLIEGRRLHVGARAGLQRIAEESVGIVSRIDGFNRVRFAGNAEARAGWVSACRVIAPSAPSSPSAPSLPIRPAA